MVFVIDVCVVSSKDVGVEGQREDRGRNGLLEEPFDVDDSLSVVPVCQLSENVLGEIDIGGRTA